MIKELLQEGFLLKSKGYYKHAIEAFYKALEIDNSSSELLLEIADLYYLMGNEERSLNYIDMILEKNPTHIESLKLLEKIFKDKCAWQQAEQTAKNIYCISRTDENLADIFKLLNAQGKYDEIFEYSTESTSAEVLYEQAFAKTKQNDHSAAESLINKALELRKDNNFLLLKGDILLKSGQKDAACEILNQLQIDETSPEVLNFAGLIMQYRDEYKKALEFFKAASRLSPKEDKYYYNIASTYFKIGDIQLAKKFYNLAISNNPENQNYHFALANLYYSEKHYKRALEELSDNFFEAKLLKSIILYDTGYLAIAKRELDKLAAESPDNPIVLDYKNRIEEELRI